MKAIVLNNCATTLKKRFNIDNQGRNRTLVRFITTLLLIGSTSLTQSQIISRFSGNGVSGYSGNGGPAVSAQLNTPVGVTFYNGNLYIVDDANHVIRVVNSAGIISNYAGTGIQGYNGDGGQASSAMLSRPHYIASDNIGNIYFTDQLASIIRKIDPSGIITTITSSLPSGYSGDGGPLAAAQISSPAGLTCDNAGNLYIADYGNNAVRKVNAAGIITTFAGNGTSGFSGDGGPATSAQLNHPYGVVIDIAGNVYIPDHLNSRIRKVDPAGIITTYAGSTPGYTGDGGPASAARLFYPWHSTIDNVGNIYVCDAGNNVIRKITSAGIITTYAGTGVNGYSGDGGPATAAEITTPWCITADNAGDIYFSDQGYYSVVRKVTNCTPAIIINSQPQNIQLCNSGNAVFAINVTNANGLQWEVNNGTGWKTIIDNGTYTGANTNTLNIIGATALMDKYQYHCKLSNGCGIAFTLHATLSVTTATAPTILISSPTNSICAGSSVQFTANTTNAGASPFYQWKKNNVNVGTNNNLYLATNLTNGDIVRCDLVSNSYCVTFNSASSNPMSITVNPLLTPTINIKTNNNNICSGTAVTFNANTTNDGSSPAYQWTKNGLNVGANSSIYVDNALNNGDIIRCNLSTNGNCLATTMVVSDSIKMNVILTANPIISITSSSASICKGEAVTFSASAVNAGTLPVFQWNKNGINVGTNSNFYRDANLSNTDLVTCSVTSNRSCFSTPSAISNLISINVFANPLVNLDKTNTICSGSIKLLDGGNFSSFLWSDGSTSRTLAITLPGAYYVKVVDSHGCIGSDTTKITTVLPKPTNFLPKDTAICAYNTILITAGPGYKYYLWNNNSSGISQTISIAGLYWLQVVDNNNCKGTDSVFISLKECRKGVYIPSAFSPNNDRKNDVFKPIIFGNLTDYKFTLYGRYGQKVFESTDPSKGWDGTSNNTQNNTSVFVWICSYQLQGETPEFKKGTVTLIR